MDLDNRKDLAEVVKRLSPLEELASNEFNSISFLDKRFIQKQLKDRIFENTNYNEDKEFVNDLVKNKTYEEEVYYNIFLDFSDRIENMHEDVSLYGLLQLVAFKTAPFEEALGLEKTDTLMLASKLYVVADAKEVNDEFQPISFGEFDIIEDEELIDFDFMDTIYDQYIFEIESLY